MLGFVTTEEFKEVYNLASSTDADAIEQPDNESEQNSSDSEHESAVMFTPFVAQGTPRDHV